jgi:hypothetical protein
MGREIKRVPLDFVFPNDASYHDAAFDQHCATCALGPAYDEGQHDECDWNYEPPEGPGWQLWQTVSDGPISPVFDTPEKLVEWMCVPVQTTRQAGPWAQGWKRDVAEPFVMRQMCSPSFVVAVRGDGSGTVVDGAEFSVKVLP